MSPAEARTKAPVSDFLDSKSVRRALVEASAHSTPQPRWWRDVRRRRLLALADCCAVGLGLALALPPERAIWMLAFLPAWILVAKLAGLYDADHQVMRHLTVDEAPVIFAWGVIGAVAASLLGGLTPAGSLSTGELALTAGVTIVADFVLRVAARAAWRASTPPERALIVGDHSLAHAMRRKIVLFADLHMSPVEPGDYARGIDRVVLAHERIDAGEIAVISELCHRQGAKLSLVSPLRGQATPHEISRLVELPVFEYLTSDVSRSTMMLKRVLDLIVGIPLAVLAAPLFPADSPGHLARGPRARSCSRSSAPASTASRSGCSSSGPCTSAPTARSRTCWTSCPSRCSSSAMTRGSHGSAACCAGSASTSFRRSGTCCAAT